MQLKQLREKPHWSYSALNTFINICSLQWAFRYAYRLEPESTSVNLVFGRAFHAVCETIARNRKNGVYMTTTEVQEDFSENFLLECEAADKLSLTYDEQEQMNITGRKMIDTLNTKWVEDEIIDVSKVFSVFVPGVSKPLIGEMDCVSRDADGKMVILDWKTASRKWSEGKADKDFQATCFSYAWKQLTGLIPNFRYDVVTKTKEPTYTQHKTYRTDDDFARMLRLVQTVEKAVNAEVFLPNETSYYCSGCEFKSTCKEYHRTQAKTISIAA